MAKFPPDRFDGVAEAPHRVGAHRSGAKRHTGLIVFAWAALACGVLVGVGVLVLTVTDSNNQFHDSSTTAATATPTATGTTKPSASKSASASASATASATPTPLLDPTQIDSSVTTISVLNSTQTAGLAANAGGVLTNGGWKVASEGNTTTSGGTSVVYYSSSAADNESIALGIAKTLGIANVQQSSAFPNSTITVVVGTDYVSK